MRIGKRKSKLNPFGWQSFVVGTIEHDQKAGEAAVTQIARYLMVLLGFVAMTLPLDRVFAQEAFPAPPPGQAVAPARDAVPFASLNGLVLPGGPSDACIKGFGLLREQAVMRGKLIKAAAERHAPPDEACQLFGNLEQSEIKMIQYVEANSANCGISPEIGKQLKAGHKNTAAMQAEVCTIALQTQTGDPSGLGLNKVLGPRRRDPPGPVGDF